MRTSFKHAAKELVSVAAALMCLLAVSVVTAFANTGLDLTKLYTSENITHLCLNAITTIFGVTIAIPLGIVCTKQLTSSTGAPVF